LTCITGYHLRMVPTVTCTLMGSYLDRNVVGDPLGPLLFCCGIQEVLNILGEERIQSFWYMDDGTIGGRVDDLCSAWDHLVRGFAKIGLEVNIEKCKWTWINPKKL